MEKRNVVFKLRSFPNISETFVVHSIVSALDNGFEVSILVDKVNPVSDSSLPELISRYRLMEKVFVYKEPEGKLKRMIHGLWIMLNPLMITYFNRYRTFRKQTNLSFLFQLNFFRKLRNTDAFHVHFADNLKPLMDLKSIGFLKSKIVVTFHGYDAHYFPSKDSNPQYHEKFESTVDHITVNSAYLKDKLVQKGLTDDHMHVIPVGIDTKLFTAKKKIPPERTWKLLSVGRMIPLKGQEMGIRAIKILKEKGYNVEFTLIGEGPLEKKLSALVKTLGLEHVIRFAGKRSQMEIKEALADHHLFLMTSSADEEGRREAFGLVSLEAQSMGVPVIGFDSGGIPETILNGETGLIVPDGDVEAYAAAIERCIREPEMWLAMSDRGPHFVRERFDKEDISKKYLALY